MDQGGKIDWIIVAATAALAVLAPWWAHRHLEQRIAEALVPALAQKLAAPVAVGAVDVDLTGTVRLAHVALGQTAQARAIEASLSLTRLLDHDGADAEVLDEIRVEGPRLYLTASQGGLDRLQLLSQEMAPNSAPGAATLSSDRSLGPAFEIMGRAALARVRRVVVSEGSLVIEIAGCGRISADGVSLHPQPGGVRAVLATTEMTGRCGPWHISGGLGRAAADIAWPSLAVQRFLAVGGHLDVTAGRAAPGSAASAAGSAVPAGSGPAPNTARLVDITIAHGVAQSTRGVEIHGRWDQAGPDAPWQARVQRRDQGWEIGIRGRDLPLVPLSPLVPRSIDLSQGRGSGRFTFTLDQRLGVDLNATLQGLVVDDRRVSQHPLEIAGTLRAAVSGTRQEIYLERFAFVTGAITLVARGRVHYDHPGYWLPDRGVVAVAVPRVPCAQALASVPPGLRHHLDGMSLDGDIAASARLRFDREAMASTALTLNVNADSCQVTREATGADPQKLLQTFAHRFADGRRARDGADARNYATLAQVPKHLPKAFIAAEDARFYDHSGFDLFQIERSLAVNLRDRAFVRGGSTISQQLVKNLFLTRDRTLARKFQEAVLTWRLESHLSKAQIIERYLNIIELGPGIFGIVPAARFWFGKPADQLTLRESAFLAALTPAPRTMSRRITTTGGIDPQSARRIDNILRNLRRNRLISESEYQRARGQRVILHRERVAPANG